MKFNFILIKNNIEEYDKCVGSDIWFNSVIYFNFYYATRIHNDKPQRMGGYFYTIRYKYN